MCICWRKTVNLLIKIIIVNVNNSRCVSVDTFSFAPHGRKGKKSSLRVNKNVFKVMDLARRIHKFKNEAISPK